ncbi:Magnesium-transporting P-type ATPase [Nitrosotalea devaniterrae]|uniref:Magnesium-transporting ATPase, P-type 1 n=1 Tax=Nitrosotalea devaniterrae TaxID=1078905 RepID=A0A128A3A2_9ARCH|nr:Magnesium-transporting P-type ATPase [Candidatus Nitrosotalea devanaterra]
MSLEKTEEAFWHISSSDLVQKLNTSFDGLTDKEAETRLQHYGFNSLKKQKRSGGFVLFITQFKSPITLILLGAAVLSLFLFDSTDALIIFVIIFLSSLLGFWQERQASNSVKKLLAMIRVTVPIIRDRIQKEIPSENIVPGDIILLSAGSKIPADCAILESKDLFVNEAVLTGETYPVEKVIGTVSPDAPISKRINSLFMGTSVVSGSGKALVVKTGQQTEFGNISDRLRLRVPETEFERGIKQFGYFLMQVTLVLVIAIFAINVYFSRPVLESLLFALALAVGLTPQLLPAIISVNLSHGARRMATQKVIVKRLSSIENFGSMNILCSDKTGTLTEGIVKIRSFLDTRGVENEKVLFYAYLNAVYETGFTNPIDEAIRIHKKFDLSNCSKLDEVPYDFNRKRITVLVSKENKHVMISKGALLNILPTCSSAETLQGIIEIGQVKESIIQQFEELSQQGLRVLGISYKEIDSVVIKKIDETCMTFLGFLVLHDPLKDGIVNTIKSLKDLGISLKVITGDNRLVASSLGSQIGLSNSKILTGIELAHLSDDALYQQVNNVDIFAEVEPNQKERIVMALKISGNVVGFIGDGINDSPSLHAADVGISVDSAVDVAKESADIVLLERNLDVLVEGVKEGRRTFANTLKYVFMATSANFGNMFSMAGVSLFLSFLPLLPKQILLTNLLTDLPETTIATDNVDSELVSKPHRWNIKFIRKFMMMFGILSSFFDFLTFGTLLAIGATVDEFRTAWFLESVVSACLIVLVVRTRQPFFKSRPGKHLLISTIVVISVTLLLPLTIFRNIFEFVLPPMWFLGIIAAIIVAYVMSAEIMKKYFYKKVRV